MVTLEEFILSMVSWLTRDIQSQNCILENSQTHWNFKAAKSTSELKYVQIQCFLKSRHRITEVEIAKSINDLMTSQSITWQRDFADYDTLDAKIASALKKASHECAPP